jgi:hypothetical protein
LLREIQAVRLAGLGSSGRPMAVQRPREVPK